MARPRTKKRTHIRSQPASSSSKPHPNGRTLTPKSMVIRVGASDVGPHISQLVRDVRLMMEPDTAGRLKERKSNKLRDYTTMAGPLGVTHLMLFSKSKETGNTNMRLALTPRGPTLHFRVEKYSLCKDVARKERSAIGGAGKGGQLHAMAPLLVMNNFTSPKAAGEEDAALGKGKGKGKEGAENEMPKQLESLTTTIFQSLFPAINPQTTPLGSIRRIMLLNRELSSFSKGNEEDVGQYTINLRHYAITTKRLGVSKLIRRLNPTTDNGKKKGLPNLSKLDDIADYLLSPSGTGYTSSSETEIETDAEVEVLETDVTRKVLNRRELEKLRSGEKKLGSGKREVEKRAVKLVELGPRMRLRMTKVEERVCGGKVMWHEFVKKSNVEVHDMDVKWDERRKMKERRREEQRENVERKRKEKGAKEGEEEPIEDEDMEDEEWDDEDFDEEVEDEDEGVELNGQGERS